MTLSQIIDIECPPGQVLAKMVLSKNPEEGLFNIYGSDSSTLRFIISRKEEKKNRNDFNICNETLEPIASITKRYEKILAIDKSVVHEDHYIRLNIEDGKALNVLDKAIILSATLIVVSIYSFFPLLFLTTILQIIGYIFHH